MKKLVWFSRIVLLLLFSLTSIFSSAQTRTGGGGGSGSGGGACTGRNCFLVQNYSGYFGDTQEILNASWSISGTTVTATIGLNFGGFTAADNGKLCWGMPTGSNGAGPSAPGTFTFISSTSGTCGPSGSLTGSASSNGLFTWGHDDTAALVAASAALYTQPKCGTLILPSARMMLSQGTSYTGTISGECIVTIEGGYFASVIEPEPGFSFSAVTNSIGTTSLGPFWETSATTAYIGFTVDGTNQNLTGISTVPAGALFTIGPGSYAFGINLLSWGTSATNGPIALNITGTFAFTIGVAFANWGNGLYTCGTSPCLNYGAGGTNNSIRTGNGFYSDYGGGYTGGFIQNGGSFLGLGTFSASNNGPFGSVASDGNSNSFLFNNCIGCTGGAPGSSGIGWEFFSSNGGNGVMTSVGSTFKGGASGGAITSQAAGNGKFIDLGGNSFTGPMTGFTGLYVPIAGGSMATRFVTASTNFGSNLTAQTLVSSVVGTTNLELKILSRQVTLGVGCSAASNTVLATISYTAPGGTTPTFATTTLTITGVGAVDSGVPGGPVTSTAQVIMIPVKVGTAVTFTTTSVLASTGCTTTPQYAVEVNI